MTDARFPERWLNDRRFNRLSDREFRAFAYTLLWSVANKTDGLLEDADLPMVPLFEGSHADQFARQGIWERRPGGWFIVDFPETQTSKLELEQKSNARETARLKKQRQRQKSKSDSGTNSLAISSVTPVPETSLETSPGTSLGQDKDKDKDRRGEDR
ncbi:hypothetical protein P9209_00155 [Prescottella defluvii]|nr:hypothetical protein P9209_00155 [Prescottella defluvii]